MVRREAPPVLRAILGAAQLTPGPRELPVSGRGLKSFTAAAPFLLLLPSVLASKETEIQKKFQQGQNQRLLLRMSLTERKKNLPKRSNSFYYRQNAFNPGYHVITGDKLH